MNKEIEWELLYLKGKIGRVLAHVYQPHSILQEKMGERQRKITKNVSPQNRKSGRGEKALKTGETVEGTHEGAGGNSEKEDR
jgi:hypothetical protein